MEDELEPPVIEWLLLPGEQAKHYSAAPRLERDPNRYPGEPGADWLGRLRRLNLFVGPNNSGKTRLLWGLFDGGLREARYLPDTLRYEEHAEECLELAARTLQAVRKVYELEHNAVRRGPNRDVLGQMDARIPGMLHSLATPDPVALWRSTLKELNELGRACVSELPRERVREQSAEIEQFIERLDGIWPHAFSRANLRFVFLPARRRIAKPGEAPPFGSSDPSSSESEKNGLTVRRTVFTGHDLYLRVRALLLGDHEERRRIREFEDFLSQSFFRNQGVTLVPKENGGQPDQLYVKIGPEREWSIDELGDGIEQILILAFPIFEYAGEHLVLFVDEPERSLHPGLQRVFAERCLKAETHGGSRQVLMCTHSNHLIDLTIDRERTSIFRISKKLPPGGTLDDAHEASFQVEGFEDEAGALQLLRDLGAQNTSMLLSNCAIWVEGVSDRNYYRTFLACLIEELVQTQGRVELRGLHEDTHYSFVEYGGGNITHWSFLDPEGPNAQSITSRMMVICDRDGGKKEPRHEKLRNALGAKNVIVLNSREVENLLTPSVIAKTLERLEGGKIEVAPTFARSAYRTLHLGKFIDQRVLKSTPTQRKGGKKKDSPYRYGDDNGVLKEKPRFSVEACEVMRQDPDLSAEAREVAEQILRFILRHNPDVARPASVRESA